CTRPGPRARACRRKPVPSRPAPCRAGFRSGRAWQRGSRPPTRPAAVPIARRPPPHQAFGGRSFGRALALLAIEPERRSARMEEFASAVPTFCAYFPSAEWRSSSRPLLFCDWSRKVGTALECRLPAESRRVLIGRPEGRPRPGRVLKDAGAPSSFRTDSAAEAGLQPVRSPVAILNDL